MDISKDLEAKGFSKRDIDAVMKLGKLDTNIATGGFPSGSDFIFNSSEKGIKNAIKSASSIKTVQALVNRAKISKCMWGDKNPYLFFVARLIQMGVDITLINGLTEYKESVKTYQSYW